VPVSHARAAVRVEGVDRVAHGSRDDDIMHGPRDAQIGNPQRLCINRAVSGAREKLAERGGVHERSSERVFLRVRAVARQIVVVGEDAC